MAGPEERLHLGLPAGERGGWPQVWAAGPTISANRMPRPDEEPVSGADVLDRQVRRGWWRGFGAGFAVVTVALWLVVLLAWWLG